MSALVAVVAKLLLIDRQRTSAPYPNSRQIAATAPFQRGGLRVCL